MALNLITNPETTPTATSDWTSLVTRSGIHLIGHGSGPGVFALTNFDTGSSVPAVAQGSIVEIGGSLYQADSDTALTFDTGLTDGLCYIKLVPGVSTATPTLTSDTFPDYDAEKGGYYDGDDRFIPVVMTRGSSGSTYTYKGEYLDRNRTTIRYTDGAMYIGSGAEINGSLTVNSGASIDGAVAINGNLSGVDALSMDGALSGVSSLSMSGALSGASSLTTSGNITSTGGGIRSNSGFYSYSSGAVGPSYHPSGTSTGGGYIKWSVYSGTLDSSGRAILSVGVDESYHYGMSGMYGISGLPFQAKIPDSDIYSTGSSVTISLGSAYTGQTYRVIVFHK